jgi:NAD(P)-dependent dehydrogenase (short-subunit alcohol dehydrogenase family)
VVNDLGGSGAGEGADQTPAQQVVDEIQATGGEAIANYDDCSSWTGAEGMVQQAIDTFGRLDVLICNAGILRDKMSFNMSEEEFDSVIRVHLKGHFAPARFAAAYWRQQSKATGEPVRAAIVTTSSEAGLYGNAGQANYAAAKAGIAAMTITLARELERSGVRVNAIAPVAATRLLGTVGVGEDLAENPKLSPDNPAAGAVWLASPLAEGITGQVLKISGGIAQIVEGWKPVTQINSDDVWTIEALAAGRETLFKERDSGIPPFRAGETL